MDSNHWGRTFRRLGFIYFSAPAALIGLVLTVIVAGASFHIQDINPDVSDNSNPNASTGGRVNGLAADPNNNQIFYAASEYGGLFKSTDGGANWSRLNGHLPVMAWDVEVDPSNSSRVYATSWYDGRVNSLAGIEVSTNGGMTWTRPATAQPNSPVEESTGADNTPQAGYTCAEPRRTEPSAFGIGIRPDAPQNVLVGTNCGVGVSTNSGATWTFFDPTPATPASDVWDVVVQAGGPSGQGIVDVCGDDRHFRSTDGDATWTGGSTGLPAGRCSIAVSPDESYVLFVVASDNNVYESDDAGATWTNLGNQAQQGRIPFVVTNQRSDSDGNNRFNLWYSDTQLFRADCTTPNSPAQGGSPRCPTSGSWTNFQTGAHWDAGDLVFDSAVTVDACPRVYSTDGGVHTNTVGGSPGCHSPTWTRSNVGLHALWSWTMDGATQAGDANEDLYFGTQDNGTFATINAGAALPTWTNPNCCDTFDMLADPSWALGTVCCFPSGRFNRLELANPGYSSNAEINTYPAGNIPGFTFAERMAQFGSNSVALITTAGLNITTNILANPIQWTSLGSPPGANICGVWASVQGGNTTFYAQQGQCTGSGNDAVFSYAGTTAGGTWNRIDNNDALTGGFGVFAADPNNPARLYASNLAPGGPQMVFSNDGGTNWDNDPELDNLMTGGGVFPYQNLRGPRTNRPSAGAVFQGYPQPSLLAFDPEDGNIIVAGGIDSGVFLSSDGGQNWALLTDPFTGNVHLPRPRFAYFDHEPAGTVNVYIGTQGRGVWRIVLVFPVADANGPYETDEGVDVVLDGSGSMDPGGGALTYEWDFDNDGLFDDATGPNPTFDLVGQDGVFAIGLRVTNPQGLIDTDQTTVTVNNVAPTVSLGSDAPVDENSPVTVSGTISDPGWLDPLTATIDWGDGTPVEAIVGVLENERPDATLSFNVSHVYGDNGTFTAEVCGSDDDTTICETISLQIDNVDPTAEIDESGATLINGVPTILAHAGDPVDFSGRSIDPGSDDLFLSWDWDDGPPAPDVTTDYLVNPPNPDPFPSPSIQPRDVTDMQTHAFADACLYLVVFSAVDDDGGSASDEIQVLIVGNADQMRTAGYWLHQYRGNGKIDFTAAELECYLEIVRFVSLVFDEERALTSFQDAVNVLFVQGNKGSMEEIFDRQLLAAWLNFANGAVEWDQMIDTDGDGNPDAAFSDVMAAAEAVRLDPTHTKQALEAQKNILERLNGGPG